MVRWPLVALGMSLLIVAPVRANLGFLDLYVLIVRVVYPKAPSPGSLRLVVPPSPIKVRP